MVANRYKQLHSDYGLYFNGIILIIAYIDNLALAGPKDLKAIMEAKRILESAFNMKNLSKSKHLLGMAITQDFTGIITV